MAKVVGLRTEILTTLTFLMGAALLLGGGLMLRLLEQGLLEQRLVQLDALTQTLSTSLVETYRRQSGTASQFSTKPLEQLTRDLEYEGWWLYDRNLNLLSAVSDAEGEPNVVSRLQQIKSGAEVVSSVAFPSLLKILSSSPALVKIDSPLFVDRQFVGLLEIHFSLEGIRSKLLFSMQIVLVYALLFGGVLVLIGYYLLQRNVVKPARDLLNATEEVGRGNLGNRLPVAGPIELARLAEAYNNMVTALLTSRKETQTHIEALLQTNQHLQIAREELIRSEKLASVGQLAAGLAHELGNPLAALIGYLEILKLQTESTETLDVVNRSLAETERIDFLVRELLDFSKPSDASPETFEPVEELRHCLALLKNQGVFSAREIVDGLDAFLPKIRMERQKLHQVVINLLLNAVQATELSGRIKLSSGVDESIVWFEIEDYGCGMKEEDLKYIFDPFFTTKPPGSGTGLGLAICHRIVEQIGGSINVSSKVGTGSCFRVNLPVMTNI